MNEESTEQTLAKEGLRARKKARTYDLIQTNALKLFTERGYEATTIEEIAEAADISPSTFFRYFATKEDVVLYDALDPVLIASFEKQSSSFSPLQALRNAMHEMFENLSKEQTLLLRQRQELIIKTPALHGKMLDELFRNIQLTAELIAKRTGRKPDDIEIRTFAGAFMGVNLAAMARIVQDTNFGFKTYQRDLEILLDQFEKGLHL
jgi:AcrR family transcriptional regulator